MVPAFLVPCVLPSRLLKDLIIFGRSGMTQEGASRAGINYVTSLSFRGVCPKYQDRMQ